MSADQKSSSKSARMALLYGAVAAWLIYDMAAATETPRQAVMIMQWVFLVCVLIGLASVLIKLASQKE